MKTFLEKIELDKWQERIDSLLQETCLEEAWFDSDAAIIGGAFEGEAYFEVFLQFQGSEYRYICPHCQGKLCVHIATMLKFFIEDRNSFVHKACQNDVKQRLRKLPWIKLAPAKKKKNLSALRKKLKTIQEGIDFAQDYLQRLFICLPKTKSHEDLYELRHQADRLAEYHLSGLMWRFKELISANDQDVLSSMPKMNQSLKRIGETIRNQLKDDDLNFIDCESYSYMGHIWKADELKSYKGRFMQLHFDVHENSFAERLEEIAVYINLLNGEICHTQNIRPYKALRHIKGENSSDKIIASNEALKYPGDQNFRIRFKAFFSERETADDYERVLDVTEKDWGVILKKVKGSLQNPFLTYRPLAFISFDEILQDGTDFFLAKDDCIIKMLNQGLDTNGVFVTLKKHSAQDAGILVEFDCNHKGDIHGRPLCLINKDQKIRLV